MAMRIETKVLLAALTFVSVEAWMDGPKQIPAVVSKVNENDCPGMERKEMDSPATDHYGRPIDDVIVYCQSSDGFVLYLPANTK